MYDFSISSNVSIVFAEIIWVVIIANVSSSEKPSSSVIATDNFANIGSLINPLSNRSYNSASVGNSANACSSVGFFKWLSILTKTFVNTPTLSLASVSSKILSALSSFFLLSLNVILAFSTASLAASVPMAFDNSISASITPIGFILVSKSNNKLFLSFWASSTTFL